MQFRLHYHAGNERRTAEVEAGSPAEAVVKFRHIHGDGQDRRPRRWRVLSVLPVEAPIAVHCDGEPLPVGDELPW